MKTIENPQERRSDAPLSGMCTPETEGADGSGIVAALRRIGALLVMSALLAAPVRGQTGDATVTVELDAERQTILGNGINFEGYHRSAGEEVLAPKFPAMMDTLADEMLRVGVPLAQWEPKNDDARPGHIRWDGFRMSEPVRNSFRRLEVLEEREARLWLAVWDMADWAVENPDEDAQRRIRDIDELAESVTAYLLRARNEYGVEPAYVSINEPTIAAETGHGGYDIALTARAQAELIRTTGERFEAHGLETKWIIALHKANTTEMQHARQVLNTPGVRPHVGGFDAHGYWWQSGHDAELAAWGEWTASTDLPAFCGECDYDNFFWQREDQDRWKHAVESGRLYHKMYDLARVSGLLVWYGDLPGESHPYRYAALHFYRHLAPGMTIVRTHPSSDSLLATAAKGETAEDRFTLVLQNADSEVRTARIEGLPAVSLQWIGSTADSYYRRRDHQRATGGTLEVRLPPRSIHTFFVE